jgi:hypothetical protein
MRKALILLCLLVATSIVAATPVLLEPTAVREDAKTGKQGPGFIAEGVKPELPADAGKPVVEPGSDGWTPPPENLTGTATVTEYSGYAYQGGLAVDASGNLYAAYYQGTISPAKVCLRRWTRATQTWATPETVSTAAVASYRPGVAVDNAGNVHVVWHRSVASYYGVWYRRWNFGTGLWSPESLLVTKYMGTGGAPGEPSIACRPGYNNIHVVWTQRDSNVTTTSPKVWHMEFTPGVGWSSPVQLDTQSVSRAASYAGVAVDASDNVHVTWQQYNASSYYRIWYRARISGAWQPIEDVSSPFGSTYQYYEPDVEVTAAGAPHVVFRGYSAGGSTIARVYYRNRNGGAWGNIDTVSVYNSSSNTYPGLSLAGDTAHVVWRGYYNASDAYLHIQYRRRLPSGFWGAVDSISSWAATSYYPAVRADRGDVHVLWYDLYPVGASYNDVWYRRRDRDPDNDMAAVSMDTMWRFVPRSVSQKVGATVRNAGLLNRVPGVPVVVNIQGPGTQAFWDTTFTATTLTPGATEAVVFTRRWTPATKGAFSVKIWTDLTGDGYRANDTTRTTGYAYPGLYETFTGATFPPYGWDTTRIAGTYANCWRRATTLPYTAPASAQFYSYLASAGNIVALRSPRLDLTQDATDSLKFYFIHPYYSSGPNDSLEAQVSTDGGASWTTLATYTLTDTPYNCKSLNLENVGQTNNAFVRLVGHSMFHQYMYVDDVMGPAVYVPTTDVAFSPVEDEMTYPLVAGEPDTILVRVRNMGLGAVGAFNVKLSANGTEVGTTPVSGLAVGESLDVKVGFTSGPSETQVSFRTYHDLVGDEIRSNDTLNLYMDWIFPAGTYEAMGFLWDLPAGFPPSTWRVLNADAGGYTWTWYFGANFHSDNQYTGCRYESGVLRNDDWIITDAQYPTAANLDSVGVWFKGSSTAGRESLEIWVMSGQTRNDTVARIWAGSSANQTTYRVARACIDAYDGQTIFIGYRNCGLNQYTMYLDDIWMWRRPLPDVGATAIVTPAGNVPLGAVVTPQVWVHNFGQLTATFDVHLQIGTVYDTAAYAVVLTPGDSTLIELAPWTATPEGNYDVTAFTVLVDDYNHANDTAYGTCSVRAQDVGAAAILAPQGSIVLNTVVTPSVKLKNYGTIASTCDLRLVIGTAYDTTETGIAIPGGDSVVHTFAKTWTAAPVGNYGVTAFTVLAGDVNPANDTAKGTCSVSLGATGWTQVADVPGGDKNKGVKDGGCLAQNPEPESTDANVAFVYLLKGNGRCEFYKYNTETNVWVAKESIPAIGLSGKKKPVKKGGTMTQAAGKMYAAKGNSTSEWWQYDPALSGTPTYPWTQKLDVPAGVKPVLKEGTGAAAVTIGDTAYVYLLRGAGGSELLRYNTLSNTWTAMTPAPAGTSGKPYKDGSALTASLDGKTLYAIKGNYNEFFAYSVDSNRWTTKEPLPLTGSSGKKKKIKSGGALAFYPGGASLEGVYCMKGNNTQEFWKYVADSDKWVQKEDVPLYSNKKVKAGGALVYVPPVSGLDQGDDNLYATIGNGTLGFFRYPPTTAPIAVSTGNSSVLGSDKPQAEGFRFEVTPNPFTTATCIRYTLPQAGNATLKLYDITGQLVTTLASGYHTTGTHTLAAPTSLAHGIYVLKLTTDNTTATRKLIVE